MNTPAAAKRAMIHDHGDEHSGGMERWLLTYSDMITLLLVLFIVLYALSSLNHVKYAEFEKGINASFNNGSALPSSAKTLPHPGRPGKYEVHMYASAATIELQLIQALRQAHLLGDVSITRAAVGVIEGLVTGKTFYSIDSAQLTPVGDEVVDVSAKVLRLYSNTDDVQGYTDNEPIVGGPYVNNWQLSAERAVFVVTRLQTPDGVDPTQLMLTGFGQYHPLVPNTSPANQAQNRRVNIVISNPPAGSPLGAARLPARQPTSPAKRPAAGAHRSTVRAGKAR